ncbi:hypothetical protein ACFLZE_00105 [Thermodesulfobacteriota bacterium]
MKINGKVKFVVLPVKSFLAILDRIEDESDLRDIREAKSEPLYNQSETEDYIFMNPVKREPSKRDGHRKNLPVESG